MMEYNTEDNERADYLISQYEAKCNKDRYLKFEEQNATIIIFETSLSFEDYIMIKEGSGYSGTLDKPINFE